MDKIDAVFDTETTGLIKNHRLPLDRQPKVIEFYGELVNRRTGEVIEELEFMANPGFPLEAIITQITGLRDADLADKPPFSENVARLIDFFARADRAVAHNISYDKAMLNFEAKRSSLEIAWPASMICTVQKTEHFMGHRLNLSKLHNHLFGEPFEGAHRAREDVKALTRSYLELVRRGVI